MKNFLVLVVLLSAAAFAEKQPQMKMNRAQVCPPHASKWCFAASEAGGFSLLLPVPFNDFTLSSKLENGEKLAIYSIGTKTPEGVKVTAQCMYNPARPANDKMARETAEDFMRTGPDTKARPVSNGALRGYEVSSSQGIVRVLQGYSAIYLIIIETPSGQAGLAAKIAPKTMASFAAQRPPKKPE